VLFDEPMSNLDAQLRAQMRMELGMLQDRLGFTAIYVTHDQAEAFALAEKVAVMNQGRIETVDEPRRVFHRPATPFVAQFLGLNVIRGRLVAAQGEFCRVALADGVELWGSVAAPLPEGTAVLFCVRKEHVAVRGVAAAAQAPAPAPGHPPTEQVFPAAIRTASFLGLQEEYIVAIGGVELGSIQPPHGLRAGERVEAVIRPSDCVVFADATGG
jgi:iron(III) transport system ATP-binding protein